MAFISAVNTSGITVFLSTLQSFLVSTIGWTLVDTAVSGLDENFVVRSSGVSGDRLIYLKFGASTVNESGISVFACVSFNSATDAAENPTAPTTGIAGTFHLNSGASLTCWFEGDLDHVQMFTNIGHTTSLNRYIYLGLMDEFRKITSAVPNLVIVLPANSFGSTNARMVESNTGSFNRIITTDTVEDVANKSDPNLVDGLVYMFPVVISDNGSDRSYGILKNAYQVGIGVADLTSLLASAVDYTVVSVPSPTSKLAVRMQ